MDFASHLKSYLSDEEINKLIISFSKKEQKGLILNTNKLSTEQFLKLFPNVIKHPIVPNAFLYNQDEYEFGKMIYHDQGCYYIQDPSATLVSYFLGIKPNQHILDMCAAPGGKSVQASLLLNDTGVLYSNDLSSSRTQILLSNIERMGLGNVVVTSLDLSKIKGLPNSFDAIILDAPCSGSGMFRKSEEMKSDWTYEKVLKAAHIQKQLICLAYSFLKEGGKLIYSTCSYSFEEDEEVVKHLLDNSNAKLLPLPDNKMFYHSKQLSQTIHLFPSKFVGEGHYIALLQKPGLLSDRNIKGDYRTSSIGASKGNSKVINYFRLPDTPNPILEKYAIRPGLFIKSKIGEKEYITHHYSHYLDSSKSYELNDEQLVKYIHGESLTISNNKNYTTVSYKGNNIGAVNQVSNVLKNLYPKGLRR